MKKESFDGKLFTLLLLRKWKRVVLFTVLGALILGVPYVLSKTIIGNFDYRATITVHVTYGEDSAGNEYDYINYYGWGEWITADAFTESLIKEYNLSVSDSELKEALDAAVPADLRIVVFSVTTKDRAKTDTIATAVNDKLIAYIEAIPEVEAAEIMEKTTAEKYFVYNNPVQVFTLGAILGFVIGMVFYWLMFLLDDSVYIPELFEREWGVSLSGEKKEGELFIDRKRPEIPDNTGSISLCIKAGAHNGKAVSYVFHECEKRGITIESIRLEDTDERLIEAYYRGNRFPNPFLKD